jgi:beta-lactamase class A
VRKSTTSPAEALLRRWDAVGRSTDAEVGAAVYRDGALVAGRRDLVSHYAASTVKLAILIAALAEGAAGRLDLERPLLIVDEFPAEAGGTFVMHAADDQDDAIWERRGTTVPMGVLLGRMIVDSSNIATNHVLAELGFDAVHRTLTRAGAEGVTLRHFIGDHDARGRGGNRATAASLARLLGLIAAGRLLSPADTQRALALLARQVHRSRIPAGLPAGTWAAGKPGWTDEVEHDVALVRPGSGGEYVFAVCTTGAGPAGAELIARMSAETWDELASWRD